jgi:hypothetical protein
MQRPAYPTPRDLLGHIVVLSMLLVQRKPCMRGGCDAQCVDRPSYMDLTSVASRMKEAHRLQQPRYLIAQGKAFPSMFTYEDIHDLLNCCFAIYVWLIDLGQEHFPLIVKDYE